MQFVKQLRLYVWQLSRFAWPEGSVFLADQNRQLWPLCICGNVCHTTHQKCGSTQADLRRFGVPVCEQDHTGGHVLKLGYRQALRSKLELLPVEDRDFVIHALLRDLGYVVDGNLSPISDISN